MAKAQFVALAVVLQRWGKRKRADSDVDSASIEEERPATRRAIGAGVCQHRSVRPCHIAISIGAAAVATWGLQSAIIPSAQAAPCPDAEVIFARGTAEAPGVGPTGEAFIDSLRTRVGAKSIGVYPVDYPATTDFPTAVDGIADARTHVIATAANCPKTKMVLGGFSQGAAVMGFVTANVSPMAFPPWTCLHRCRPMCPTTSQRLPSSENRRPASCTRSTTRRSPSALSMWPRRSTCVWTTTWSATRTAGAFRRTTSTSTLEWLTRERLSSRMNFKQVGPPTRGRNRPLRVRPRHRRHRLRLCHSPRL